MQLSQFLDRVLKTGLIPRTHMPGNEAMVISQLMLPQLCLVLTCDHKPAAAVAPRLVGDEYRMPVGWTGRGQVNGENGRLARK